MQAVEANNAVWPLLARDDRSADDDEALLRHAYAAAYDWERAAGRGPAPTISVGIVPPSGNIPTEICRTTSAKGVGSVTGVEFTVLGQTVRHPVEHVEVFPAPEHVTAVTFTTDELASVCPVTEQPDLSHVVIEYEPREWCVESKSLKLYLWGFRDRAVFAEALAAEIAGEIMATAKPRRVSVALTQRPRGGIEVHTEAELSAD